MWVHREKCFLQEVDSQFKFSLQRPYNNKTSSTIENFFLSCINTLYPISFLDMMQSHTGNDQCLNNFISQLLSGVVSKKPCMGSRYGLKLTISVDNACRPRC